MIIVLMSIQQVKAQSDKLERFKDRAITTTVIKVYGECGSCKHRIENALKVSGVTAVAWNNEAQLLSVQYNDKVITLDKIHSLLAAAGHDTDKIRATDMVYQKLPDCCHYTRKQV